MCLELLATGRLAGLVSTPVTARELRRVLKRRGCDEVRQVGSHLSIRCGECVTTIAVHTGDIPTGTLRKIERDLEPCLGKGWMLK